MARDMRNWMWAEALALLDQAERVHRGAYRPGTARRAACWEPPVDVLETDESLWIQVALPGVTPEQLKVGIEGDALVVTGERTLPVPRGAGVIRRLEMPYGSFERRIELPAGRYELVGRELALGCLTLTLRKLA
jgi:HSP20 family protein